MSRQRLSPEGRKGVEEYSANELHTFLVEDAVKRHATFLPWAVKAYERIGAVRHGGGGEGAETAYSAVLDEVEALTGLRMMPVASPATAEEMRRLGL